MKKTILLINCLIIYQLAFSQTVLLHEKISDYDFDVPRRGPNFRHFSHLYIGYAIYIPREENEIETKPGSTTTLAVGWRYKFKITNWLAIGAGLNYTNDVFNLVQNENKVIPNEILHDKEKLRYNNLGPDVFLRLNFGKRGNVIGRFIDFGAFYNWSFKVKHMYQDKSERTAAPNQAGKERVILSDLDYIERFHYGLRGRVGINRFVITASYRLNELLREEYRAEKGNLFFPRLNLGLEIGLHK